MRHYQAKVAYADSYMYKSMWMLTIILAISQVKDLEKSNAKLQRKFEDVTYDVRTALSF